MCVDRFQKTEVITKPKLRQSLKTSSLSFGRANNESMHPDKRIRYTLTAVVANTLLAISAFCCAFILAAAGLPSEIMATSIAATVGMFVAYGTVVAALLVFGNTRLSVRLLATFVSVAIFHLAYLVGFGPMNEFAVTTHHFLAIVIVAMLWLGLIQNIFGLKLVRGECDSLAFYAASSILDAVRMDTRICPSRDYLACRLIYNAIVNRFLSRFSANYVDYPCYHLCSSW